MKIPKSVLEAYPNCIWKQIFDTKYIINNLGTVLIINESGNFKVKHISHNTHYPEDVYNISIHGSTYHYSTKQLMLMCFGREYIDMSKICMLPLELFVDIPNTDGVYMVSNYGRILSLTYIRGRYAKIITGRSIIHGHPYVNLRINNKYKLYGVRRLVAHAFVDNPEALKYVYSDDATTTTMKADSLYYVSSSNHMSNMGKKSSKNKCRAIRCIETGEEFPSITEASKHFNVGYGLIVSHIKRHEFSYQIDFNYTFEYISEAQPVVSHIPCICNETGVVYNSVKSAAKDLGLSEKQVNRAVKKGGSVQGKYTFSAVGDNNG